MGRKPHSRKVSLHFDYTSVAQVPRLDQEQARYLRQQYNHLLDHIFCTMDKIEDAEKYRVDATASRQMLAMLQVHARELDMRIHTLTYSHATVR